MLGEQGEYFSREVGILNHFIVQWILVQLIHIILSHRLVILLKIVEWDRFFSIVIVFDEGLWQMKCLKNRVAILKGHGRLFDIIIIGLSHIYRALRILAAILGHLCLLVFRRL